MSQLTAEERRRIFINRQQTKREMLRRRSAPAGASESLAAEPPLGRIVELVLGVALLGAGWLIYQAVAFRVPTSFAEILPRL